MSAIGKGDEPIWFSAGSSAVMECHDCGLVQRVPDLDYGDIFCVRCKKRLHRILQKSLASAFALGASGLIVLTIALLMPFITVDFAGRLHHSDLVTGIWEFANLGFYELAFFVLLNTIVAPAVIWLFSAAVPLLLQMRRPPRAVIPMVLWIERLSPWAMVEVYLIALFVSYTKLVDLATVTFGPAVYAMAAMMMITVIMHARIDHGEFWVAMERRGLTQRPPPSDVGRTFSCHGCGLLLRLWSRPTDDLRCPRCRSAVHHRKPHALGRTWAFLIAAAVFYVPANLYPVMTMISLGKTYPSTIFGGVIEMIHLGSWPLALIIFCASIAVPGLKIFSLALLLITTQLGSRWRLHDRTRLYRLVELIGRWSMIDVYVVSVLIALVQIGQLATFFPGLGATCFATVVVLTMLAAMSFDPRLMWDRAGMNQGEPTAAQAASGALPEEAAE